MRSKWTVMGLVAILVAYLAAIRIARFVPAELVPVRPELLGWALTPILFLGFLVIVVLWQLRQPRRDPDQETESD